MAPFGKAPPPQTPTAPAQLRGTPGATVIGRETRLSGELSGTRGVRVEGTLQGTVDLKAPFEVVEGATVEAEVHATTVRIGGTVVGNVTATELVELLAGAAVKGDVSTPALHVVEGAKLEGRVLMRIDERPVRPAASAKGPLKDTPTT